MSLPHLVAPRCGRCNEEYDLSERRPLQGSCGHAICRKCRSEIVLPFQIHHCWNVDCDKPMAFSHEKDHQAILGNLIKSLAPAPQTVIIRATVTFSQVPVGWDEAAICTFTNGFKATITKHGTAFVDYQRVEQAKEAMQILRRLKNFGEVDEVYPICVWMIPEHWQKCDLQKILHRTFGENSLRFISKIRQLNDQRFVIVNFKSLDIADKALRQRSIDYQGVALKFSPKTTTSPSKAVEPSVEITYSSGPLSNEELDKFLSEVTENWPAAHDDHTGITYVAPELELDKFDINGIEFTVAKVTVPRSYQTAEDIWEDDGKCPDLKL